ncbi:hypothetical protein MTYP_01602 [Methylophilaceae bacterium]|nr:hypothetical protein MTYP_01602 [Methylophilaceae bacterium]
MSDASQELQALKAAVEFARNGDWHNAHLIAQDSNHQLAHWIHAVLHKIEGDEWNSRYWYRRTDKNYEDFADSRAELSAILQILEDQS